MKNGEYILVKSPKNFPGKIYRNRYCLEHHLVYYNFYGITPSKDEIIHHKDGNKFNNDIHNLQLMTISDHNKLHHRTGRTMVKLRCPCCKKSL